MSLIADIHNDLEKGAIRLIAEYRGRLFSEAIRLCGDLTTAEDLVSRTFAKAIDNIDSYKEDVNLFGWLKTILTNLYRNDQRRAVNRNTDPVDPQLLEDTAALDWQTDEQILRDSDSEAVRTALAQLDSKYSQVMLMRYYEDMSVKEIAAFLNKPIGTVLRRIQIAHQLLAGKLGVKLGKVKKPLAVLGAVLLGAGVLWGAVVSPLGDWARKLLVSSEPSALELTPTEKLTQADKEGEGGVNISSVKKVAVAAVASVALQARSLSGQMAVETSYGSLIHVETTGSDETGDGSSEKPYATLPKALTYAQAGDTVLLGEGTFEVDAQVELTRAITVRGAGHEKTTVRASSSKNIRVFHLNCKDAVVSSLKITGGNSILQYIGGVWDGHGGGVWIDSAGGSLVECRVTGNNVDMNCMAAGIYMTGADGRVIRCISDHNTDGSNWAQGGNGIYLTAGRVENCLFYGNTCAGAGSGSPAAGVIAIGGMVVNCTIADNTGLSGGISAFGTDKNIINCIIFGNSKTSGDVEWMGFESCYENCLFVDPQFVDPANGDYSLRGVSPAIDAGGVAEFEGGGTDLAGNPRVLRKLDLGCYENLDDETTLLVTATPSEYGTVTPAYGTIGSLQPGESLTAPLTAPASFTEDGVDIVCDGWKLYSQNAQTLEWTLIGESGADNKTSCAYTHPTPAARTKLVWQWRTACHIAAAANPGGVVSAGDQVLGIGEVATIKAIPDDDVLFSRWTGDVPKGMERVNPLVFTVDAAHSVTAHFIAKTTYVRPKTDAAANPLAPYRTRETAATDIGDFADDLVDGCTVVVMDGINDISKTVSLDFAVTFEGEHGWTNATVRRTGALADGDRVFRLNHAQAVLRGLTITGGNAGNLPPGGGGVLIDANGGLVEECRVTGNNAGMNSGGAGIYMSAGRVTHSIVDNNRNETGWPYPGGGIYIAGGAVDNCLVCSNFVNGANRGEVNEVGGVYAVGGTVSNCTIVANQGWKVCGAEAVFSSDMFVNCIIYGNKFSNASTDVPVQYAGSGFVNCLFPVGTALPNDSCRAGSPKFVSEATFDYHIDVGSAAIKQGVNGCWTADDVDLDGKPRLGENGELDIGCYSYFSSGFACSIDASEWKILAGGSATFYAKVDDSVDPADYVYSWTLTNTTGLVRLESSLQNPVLTFDTAGRYSVKLVVCAKDSDAPLYEHEILAEFLVSPTTAYVVEANPHAAYPFDSELTAATNVLEALADLTDGSTLKIGPGTFEVNETVELVDGITVKGSGADVTTVKRMGPGRVFRLNNDKACVCRLTMTGGNSGFDVIVNGAGVLIDANGGLVEECRVTGNNAGMNSGGAGIYMFAGRVTRSIIDNNRNENNYPCPGGGIYIAGGAVDNCLVCGNFVNGASRGEVSEVGGVYAVGGTVSNCTIVANQGWKVCGAEAVVGSDRFVNCIVYGNKFSITSSGEPVQYSGAGFVKCLFPPNTTLPNDSCEAGDPLFKDAANLDFHLRRGSPAINVGVNGSYTADDTDLDGNSRVHNFGRKSGIVDLGCYETPWGTPGFLLLVK